LELREIVLGVRVGWLDKTLPQNKPASEPHYFIP